MSQITKALWETEFTHPMPDGMTYAVFARLADQQALLQSVDDTVALIRDLETVPQTPAVTEWLKLEQLNLADYYRRLAS